MIVPVVPMAGVRLKVRWVVVALSARYKSRASCGSNQTAPAKEGNWYRFAIQDDDIAVSALEASIVEKAP